MSALQSAPSPVHPDFADLLAYLNDSPDNDLSDYRPGWDDGYVPTAEDDAAWADLAARLEAARLDQEELEFHAWLDELARDREQQEPFDAWHESEVIRAIGCVAARKAVGL